MNYLAFKINNYCNNCLHYTHIDESISKRKLHHDVYSICNKMNIFPKNMKLNKDDIEMNIDNKSTFVVKPNDNSCSIIIPKENIEIWEELYKNLNNEEKFLIKNNLHEIVEQYDKRKFRVYSVVNYREDPTIFDISLGDYTFDKKNEMKNIRITKDGIQINYKIDTPHNLYKAFNLSFYKFTKPDN